jgi:hypothetical protein
MLPRPPGRSGVRVIVITTKPAGNSCSSLRKQSVEWAQAASPMGATTKRLVLAVELLPALNSQHVIETPHTSDR